MSKEMRRYIDNFRNYLTESSNKKLNDPSTIISQIDEKMDRLIGEGDYNSIYNEDQDRFIVSFREGDIDSSCELADEVVDYVNNQLERNVLRVGNCGKEMFWLTWTN